MAVGAKRHILFLGPGTDGLHLVAQAFARRIAGPEVEVVAASLQAVAPPDEMVRVMAERGLRVREGDERSLVDLEVFAFDMVVTLGDFDPACRPNLPGMPPNYHWDLPSAPERTESGELLLHYRAIRDDIERRVSLVFASDMLRGLSIARRNLELVLDNLAHAVMAHTLNRRIFYFNKAAERITGFRREEILGIDCHEVFTPQRFCGGGCLFCEAAESAARCMVRTRTATVPFTRPDGEERFLEMTIMPLADAEGTHVGALLSFEDQTELNALRQRLTHRHTIGSLVGRDPKTLALFDQIREVAPVNVAVLIEGESGTGKELVAQAIHQESSRAGGPFVPVNCGALPEGILESELFGHVRGAFTGAVQDKKGRFELADGGTLFLDEVAELTAAMQVKLLRVLQDQSFERVGGERRIHVDVRVLSATNQNLRRLMEEGRFRRDLYYRLCVIPIFAPPLCERPLDIPVLVDVFLDETAAAAGRPALTPSNEALDALMRYPWPGNVRELRNAVEYVNVKCRDRAFHLEHLPPPVLAYVETDQPLRRARRGPEPKFSDEELRRALERTGGNKSRAAALLGVGRTTLYRRLGPRRG